MSKNKFAVTILFLVSLAQAQEISVSPDRTVSLGPEKEVIIGNLTVKTEVKGTPSAYETYDILAPFDGRIDEVRAELFDLIYPEIPIARAVTKDMAALLDTANTSDPQAKKQILKRWKGTFEYYDIKPSFKGIVTNVYVKPKDYVNQGDKLFTIAKKMQVIASNSKPIFSPISPMMKAELVSVRDNAVKLTAYLKSFVPIKEKPFFYRLWFDVEELKDRVKIGEVFEGEMLVGKSENAKIVQRKDLFMIDGKRYMLMEVEPGLISETEIEIINPKKTFISPVFKEPETKKSEEVKTEIPNKTATPETKKPESKKPEPKKTKEKKNVRTTTKTN